MAQCKYDHKISYTYKYDIFSSLEAEIENILARTIITIWNVTQPDRPLYVLTTPELVTTACFQQERSSLVFVGSEWGAINLWDLRLAIFYIFTVKIFISFWPSSQSCNEPSVAVAVAF